MEFLLEHLELILTFIASVVIILLSGFTARKKGASFALGAIFGLLFNFIGLVILSLLPDKQPRHTENNNQAL
ncbi:hypothetical protein [Fodinibius halophilus]|uniref:Uncharacterized protein n=1 Tax=Fodinibius halophilus TaxID=1736908 RepID=A0A6M1TB01_9BACT|nr:hypothetical protein [Fodinibius halophilus]NGP87512.1 hypothetical protein [Fodinibius halophilus]